MKSNEAIELWERSSVVKLNWNAKLDGVFDPGMKMVEILFERKERVVRDGSAVSGSMAARLVSKFEASDSIVKLGS